MPPDFRKASTKRRGFVVVVVAVLILVLVLGLTRGFDDATVESGGGGLRQPGEVQLVLQAAPAADGLVGRQLYRSHHAGIYTTRSFCTPETVRVLQRAAVPGYVFLVMCFCCKYLMLTPRL